MNAPRARVLAGIDEAGLGPLLGPLTVGWSVLRAPADGRDPYEALADAVCSRAGREETRLLVADSKEVFDRTPRGARRLEATVLAFLRAAGARPTDGRELLTLHPAPLSPAAHDLADHPWYARLPELPCWEDPARLAADGERLRAALDAGGAALLEAGVRALPAGELNRSFARTGSKARTTWEVVGDLLLHLFERHGDQDLQVTLDRQGGRTRYAEVLAATFPMASLAVLEERADSGRYRVERGALHMELVVRPRAEQGSLVVALASCLAKYARELVMEAFNGWFAELQPDLRPTAGYVTDARRWLAEAAPALARAELPPGRLVRER